MLAMPSMVRQSGLRYLTIGLEIENPGLLPFGLTIEDIQRGVSKLRDGVIGQSLSRTAPDRKGGVAFNG
jgi:hypothetical protein